MKPILIFRHSPTEGPGYFSRYLDRKGLPWQLIRIDAGDLLPVDSSGAAGLCFMGGPMSVNDDLPWIAPVLELIRDARRRDVPVIGHCLGGQLMSRAFGGVVSRNPVKEIGWGTVSVLDDPLAGDWFGGLREFGGFHWHGETFTVPEGATRIAFSRYCANQAFVIGKHLGMQCHVEMTTELVETWCREWGREVERVTSASIQTPAEIQAGLDAAIGRLHGIADRLYDRWITGLAT